MRVSAAGWLYDSMERTREVARATANVTHNHPEGIKGAEATASAIYMARNGSSKEEIKEYIDYSQGEIDFVTKPMNEMRLMECTECEMSAPAAYDIDIEADDIDVTDTVTVVWEIAQEVDCKLPSIYYGEIQTGI